MRANDYTLKFRYVPVLISILFVMAGFTPLDAYAPKPAGAEQEIRTIDDIPLYPSEAARQKVKSYTHGNYALDLFGTFYFILLLGLIAFTRTSARLRDFTRRIFTKRPLVIFFYWALFFSLITILTFPLDYYKEFYREHLYGFSQQSFPDWLGDYLKGFAIGIILGGLFFMILYWVFKKSPSRWWVWGCLVSIVFAILSIAIAPELIAPLFNKYEPIKDAKLRGEILSLVQSHGIHPQDVYEVDASRQSNKIGAFVFGLLGTQRIVLTDTLIQRCTPPEVLVVVGHEIGHYILNHIWKGIAFFSIVIFLFGYLLQLILRKILTRYENKLGFREVSDVASLPLILLIFTLLFFLVTPLFNWYSRYQEAQADWYGLESTGYWRANIEVDKKLGEYREMDPHPINEILFFDHPSGKNRIKMALKYRDQHARR